MNDPGDEQESVDRQTETNINRMIRELLEGTGVIIVKWIK